MDEYAQGAAAIDEALLGPEEAQFVRRVRELALDRNVHVTVHNEGENQPTLTATMRLAERNKHHPHTANAVRVPSPEDRDLYIAAFIEQIEFIQRQNFLSGVVLDSSMVSRQGQATTTNMVHTERFLGEGNRAGRIMEVRDPGTGRTMAHKSIMVSDFRGGQIKLWVHLADWDLAPKLYSFFLNQGTVNYHMETLEGQTMEQVIDNVWASRDLSMDDRRSFALVLLEDMLGIFQKMNEIKHSHGDLHSKNVFLDKTMKLKFIDFESAKKYLMNDVDATTKTIQFDIIGIIRIFAGVFCAYCFDNMIQARKVLMAKDLDSLNEFMTHLPPSQREEMYDIIMRLFETVSDPRMAVFGDTQPVAGHIRQKISPDQKKEIKTKVACILFPERFQPRLEEEADDLFLPEGCVDDHTDSPAGITVKDPDHIWHDPRLELYAKRITDKQLAELNRGAFA